MNRAIAGARRGVPWLRSNEVRQLLDGIFDKTIRELIKEHAYIRSSSAISHRRHVHHQINACTSLSAI